MWIAPTPRTARDGKAFAKILAFAQRIHQKASRTHPVMTTDRGFGCPRPENLLSRQTGGVEDLGGIVEIERLYNVHLTPKTQCAHSGTLRIDQRRQ